MSTKQNPRHLSCVFPKAIWSSSHKCLLPVQAWIWEHLAVTKKAEVTQECLCLARLQAPELRQAPSLVNLDSLCHELIPLVLPRFTQLIEEDHSNMLLRKDKITPYFSLGKMTLYIHKCTTNMVHGPEGKVTQFPSGTS